MAAWLWSICLLVSVYAKDIPRDITIDSSATCGDVHQVAKEDEFRLFATGNSPAADCSFTFNADAVAGSKCSPGLCYMFDTYAKLQSPFVTLTVEAGTKAMVYVNRTRLPQGPICAANEDMLKVILSQTHDYVYNDTEPGYMFRMSVYHHCGTKGQVKNIKFEDAVEYATGYHHGEEKETNERNHFIYGICVGFGLAVCFLITFAIAFCCIRNSPNRGVRNPSGAKVEYTTRKPAKRDAEMVTFKSRGTDRGPEGNVLLTSAKRS